MLTSDMQGFLSDLIRLGHESPPARFKQKALELLQKLIPFDMALWASGHTEGLKVHNVYLHELPQRMMQSWENIKHQDRLLASIIAHPGQTFDVYDFYAKAERRLLEVYRQHSGVFGIEAAISTAIPDPEAGLLEVMSLYRKNPKQRFSTAERSTKQSLFPLLSQIWHHNQIQHLKLNGSGYDRGFAGICDRQGWLRHAESGFIALIKAEFPGWLSPELPGPLVQSLRQNSNSEYKGRTINVDLSRQNDLTLLQAKNRGAMGLLTAREEQVAASFAAGLTYKEIAAELAVAPSTVRRHLESVYRKLDVCNKLELFQVLHGDTRSEI